MEQLSCEVLIVGSGGAGLRAAIAAREKGIDVLVVSKASPGKATSTTVSAGVFAGTPRGVSPDNHMARTLQAGRGINQLELVRVLVDEAPQRLQELIQWGINAEFREGYLYSLGAAPMWGREITQCLIAKCKEMGVRFLGGMVVAALNMKLGTAGVIAYSVESGKWMAIDAGALVLATGGAGALYQRHDNPRRMLGDGYVLAFNAGAVLQYMEFVQFYPFGVAEPEFPSFLIPPRLADHGELRNGRGEEIYEKYNITERPAGERARDRLSQALFIEIHRHGREVWLNLTGVSEDDWHKDPFSGSTRKILGDRYGAADKPLRVAPMAHHVMGGIRIDAQGFTSVPGLFAAGEVSGGIHGANRMGGNALTETMVFGKRAGDAAAQWAVDSEQRHPEIGADELKAFLQNSSKGKTQLQPEHLAGQLRQLMWTEGGILRNKKGLIQTLEAVKNIQHQAAETSLEAAPDDVQRILELRFAAATAALVLKAARKREESRGAHFREDFQDQDDENWKGALQVHCNSEGEQIWRFKPIGS
jgi:succinate dehydrogenase/fumarate reductase flavoprotein subunit